MSQENREELCGVNKDWLSELFARQLKLDTFISTHKGVKGTVEDTFSAYMVELGEFLNEVRAFKFWTVKGMDKEKAYEEFVDGLHFILSLGNSRFGEFDTTLLQERVADLELEESMAEELLTKDDGDKRVHFVNVSNSLYLNSRSLFSGDLESYEDYFVSFLRLGRLIGMSVEGIISEYLRKNQINYDRQLNGY